MRVAVYWNLVTLDGRSCVEVRQAQEFNGSIVAKATATLYSCAYDRSSIDFAVNRALNYCQDNRHTVLDCHDCQNNRRAFLQ